jgi:hypothetical protein
MWGCEQDEKELERFLEESEDLEIEERLVMLI